MTDKFYAALKHVFCLKSQSVFLFKIKLSLSLTEAFSRNTASITDKTLRSKLQGLFCLITNIDKSTQTLNLLLRKCWNVSTFWTSNPHWGFQFGCESKKCETVSTTNDCCQFSFLISWSQHGIAATGGESHGVLTVLYATFRNLSQDECEIDNLPKIKRKVFVTTWS